MTYFAFILPTPEQKAEIEAIRGTLHGMRQDQKERVEHLLKSWYRGFADFPIGAIRRAIRNAKRNLP